MGREPFPRNQRCPCGSGEKYKRCCFVKGFHYYIDHSTGEVLRDVPISEQGRQELAPLMEAQRQRFIEKFGREPEPEDPVFFDLPDENTLKRELAETMRKAGIRPALIYATEKTGLLVTEENRNLIPDIDLAEWEAAIDEYYEQHPEEDPSAD